MEQTKNVRYNIIIVIIYIVGIVLLAQLFNLQIIQGNTYRETSNTRLSRESTVKAARGDITDSSGNKLVTTETGFSLELYKTKLENDVLNNVIYNLVVLLENNKDTYNDNLPITVEPYAFTLNDEETQKKWKKEYGIDEEAFIHNNSTKRITISKDLRIAHEYIENELKSVPPGRIGTVMIGREYDDRCVCMRVDGSASILMVILWIWTYQSQCVINNK